MRQWQKKQYDHDTELEGILLPALRSGCLPDMRGMIYPLAVFLWSAIAKLEL